MQSARQEKQLINIQLNEKNNNFVLNKGTAHIVKELLLISSNVYNSD